MLKPKLKSFAKSRVLARRTLPRSADAMRVFGTEAMEANAREFQRRAATFAHNTWIRRAANMATCPWLHRPTYLSQTNAKRHCILRPGCYITAVMITRKIHTIIVRTSMRYMSSIFSSSEIAMSFIPCTGKLTFHMIKKMSIEKSKSIIT